MFDFQNKIWIEPGIFFVNLHTLLLRHLEIPYTTCLVILLELLSIVIVVIKVHVFFYIILINVFSVFLAPVCAVLQVLGLLSNTFDWIKNISAKVLTFKTVYIFRVGLGDISRF